MPRTKPQSRVCRWIEILQNNDTPEEDLKAFVKKDAPNGAPMNPKNHRSLAARFLLGEKHTD